MPKPMEIQLASWVIGIERKRTNWCDDGSQGKKKQRHITYSDSPWNETLSKHLSKPSKKSRKDNKIQETKKPRHYILMTLRVLPEILLMIVNYLRSQCRWKGDYKNGLWWLALSHRRIDKIFKLKLSVVGFYPNIPASQSFSGSRKI